jgi:hypothetical protein
MARLRYQLRGRLRTATAVSSPPTRSTPSATSAMLFCSAPVAGSVADAGDAAAGSGGLGAPTGATNVVVPTPPADATAVVVVVLVGAMVVVVLVGAMVVVVVVGAMVVVVVVGAMVVVVVGAGHPSTFWTPVSNVASGNIVAITDTR